MIQINALGMKNIFKAFLLATALISCTKDKITELTINSPLYSLHYDETHQYRLKEGNSEIGNSQITWSIQDTLLGKIDGNGLFSARRIGTTVIEARKGNTVVSAQVTVKPYSFLFEEPIFEHGKDRDYVYANEKRPPASVIENPHAAEFDGENEKVKKVSYEFDPTYGIRMVRVVFVNRPEVIEEIRTFLCERYQVTTNQPNNMVALRKGIKHLAVSFNSSRGPQIEYFY